MSDYVIREARPEEFDAIGRLLVEAYAQLPGMPGVDEQPAYYELLRDVGRRARSPAIRVLVAVDARGQVLGSVDFIDDAKHYGAGPAIELAAAGMRLLAVRPDCRGRRLGEALTRACIERTHALGWTTLVLHTTRAMQTAWRLYERLGFERRPELDFQQGALAVYGFALAISRRESAAPPLAPRAPR